MTPCVIGTSLNQPSQYRQWAALPFTGNAASGFILSGEMSVSLNLMLSDPRRTSICPSQSTWLLSMAQAPQLTGVGP